jgi:hypothetical protein
VTEMLRCGLTFSSANYGRQKIITMPRSVPKIAIFEEAARTAEAFCFRKSTRVEKLSVIGDL